MVPATTSATLDFSKASLAYSDFLHGRPSDYSALIDSQGLGPILGPLGQEQIVRLMTLAILAADDRAVDPLHATVSRSFFVLNTEPNRPSPAQIEELKVAVLERATSCAKDGDPRITRYSGHPPEARAWMDLYLTLELAKSEQSQEATLPAIPRS